MIPSSESIKKRLFSDDCQLHLEEPSEEGPFFDEEASLMKHAAPKVYQLFSAGRRCAHRGLEKLGVSESVPIGRAEDRRPLWPQDKIGSITHTQGLAGAVVACASTHCGLGLDVECIDRKIQPQLMERVSNHKEQEELMHEPYGLLKLLSAKEAVFKACYPLDGVYLGFLDAECLLKRDGFSVRLLKSVHPNIPVGFEFDVLQTVDQGYLFSGCELHTSLLFT